MNNKDFLCEDIVLKSIPRRVKKVLDFGCGDGSFTEKLYIKGRKIYGCDADLSVLKDIKANKRKVEYTHISTKGNTPYKSNFFDCVTMMGVLEHVFDENITLNEIHRILKKGGILYIYGLNKGLFGFLDTGNIKFTFPKLHKVLYKYFYSEKEYQKEFVLKRKQGMIGDVTVGRNSHTHYSKNDLIKLLSSRFKLKKHWLYSFTLPIILALDFVYYSIFKKESKLFIWMARIDQKIKLGNLSYSFVAECKKI
ncbi:MAG: class I SAM-dependent methyltransferase [Patescibacteria group bacterium]